MEKNRLEVLFMVVIHRKKNVGELGREESHKGVHMNDFICWEGFAYIMAKDC